MRSTPAALDAFDAQCLQDDIAALVSDPTSGRAVTYVQPQSPIHHPSAGVVAFEPVTRLIRVYRGGEDSRKTPGADVGTQKIIALRSELDHIVPQAGDHIIDNGQRFAVDLVEYGDVGPTRVYYLLSVTAAGVA